MVSFSGTVPALPALLIPTCTAKPRPPSCTPAERPLGFSRRFRRVPRGGRGPAGRSGYIRLHVRGGEPAGRAERRAAPGGGPSRRATADPGRGRDRQDTHAGGPGGLAVPAGHATEPGPAADLHPPRGPGHAVPG